MSGVTMFNGDLFDISFWVALQEYHGVKKIYDITLMLNLEKNGLNVFLKNKK